MNTVSKANASRDQLMGSGKPLEYNAVAQQGQRPSKPRPKKGSREWIKLHTDESFFD